LSIFKRLYNSFQIFRKNLEDPILSCLVSILKIHKKEQDLCLNYENY
jgi:hypothetical protein